MSPQLCPSDAAMSVGCGNTEASRGAGSLHPRLLRRIEDSPERMPSQRGASMRTLYRGIWFTLFLSAGLVWIPAAQAQAGRPAPGASTSGFHRMEIHNGNVVTVQNV